MVSETFGWVLLAALAFFSAAGLWFYLPLAWRIFERRDKGAVGIAWVGKVDGVIALVLAVWFAMLAFDALTANGESVIGFRQIVGGAMIYGAIVVFIVGTLVFRGIFLAALPGWSRQTFVRHLGRALLYLLAAYPLILLVQMVALAFSGDASPQDIVQFLQKAETVRDRAAVLIMAVVVAPLAEEFIFRGYLYPVGKKYAGPFLSAVVTSAIFALPHGHPESAPSLFVLALCLTLSYEKSGSLLVSVLMHSVFNALSVAGILFFL